MRGVELVLAFLAGVVMSGALDRFVLPLVRVVAVPDYQISPGILLLLLNAILALLGLEASAGCRACDGDSHGLAANRACGLPTRGAPRRTSVGAGRRFRSRTFAGQLMISPRSSSRIAASRSRHA